MLDTVRQKPLDDLIYQLNLISNEEFDNENAKFNKAQLSLHPMKDALFAELCEIKLRTAMSPQTSDLTETNSRLMRLDNMLIAENVIGPERKLPEDLEDSRISHTDYQIKLKQLRSTYQQQIQQNQETENNFSQQVTLLLQGQKFNRPITDQEIASFVDIIRQKFIETQIKIKQCTCENVIEFKSKFFDARRKRKNFSKRTTEILNTYFNSHIENPYPSEEVKEQLAKQCNISVGQVNNWFGNKRIRYKKSIPRMQEEANRVAEQRALEQVGQFDMFNTVASGLINPYSAMFSGNPDFYSSMNFPNPNNES